jgi:DnaK suppressor protein
VVKKPAPRPATKTAAVPAPAPAASATPAKASTPAKTAVSKSVETVKTAPTGTPDVGNNPSRPSPQRPAGKVAVAVAANKDKAPAPRGKVKVVDYQTDEATGRPIVPKGYLPSPDEEYMNPLQLEYFRQRLLKWRADLVEESKQTIENLKDEVRDVGDEAERATRETENSLELRTRDRYRKLISKIDSTLKRVDSGDYGFCVDTGEEIGLERLEARLTAERTIDAQERWEHMQKQMGD